MLRDEETKFLEWMKNLPETVVNEQAVKLRAYHLLLSRVESIMISLSSRPVRLISVFAIDLSVELEKSEFINEIRPKFSQDDWSRLVLFAVLDLLGRKRIFIVGKGKDFYVSYAPRDYNPT